MSKQKQHYVPKVYFKRFTYDSMQNIFSLKKQLKSKKDGVNKTNTTKECYEVNRFRIRNLNNVKHLGISDDNFIENNGFQYESSELTTLFDELDQRMNFTRTQVRRLLEILFSIKRRNPAISDLFTSEFTYDSSVKTINELTILLEETQEVIDHNHLAVQQCLHFIQQDVKDPSFIRDLYNSILIAIEKQDYEEEKARIENILNSRFTILQTKYEVPFITSDNPGYTMTRRGEVHNFALGHVDFFLFPLSPRSLLHITLKESDQNSRYMIQKQISYRFISPKEVLSYNLGTLINSRAKVFGSNRDSLTLLKALKNDYFHQGD